MQLAHVRMERHVSQLRPAHTIASARPTTMVRTVSTPYPLSFVVSVTRIQRRARTGATMDSVVSPIWLDQFLCPFIVHRLARSVRVPVLTPRRTV